MKILNFLLTGGFAYGMPRKTAISLPSLVLEYNPLIRPTGASTNGPSSCALAKVAKSKRCRKVMLLMSIFTVNLFSKNDSFIGEN